MIDVAVGGGATVSGDGPLQPLRARMFGSGTYFEPTQKIMPATLTANFIYINWST